MWKIEIIKEISLLRDGIVSVLERRFPNDIITAKGAAEFGEMFKSNLDADLVIIDLNTKIDILHLVQTLKNQVKRVIVWASTVDQEELIQTFQMKCSGYFFNGMEEEELVGAIHKVMAGDSYIHPELAPVLLEDYVKVKANIIERPIGVLSHREWEVLELMSRGMSNEQIGNSLYITDKTVKNHVSSILKKLQVNDRINAVLHALKKHWIAL